MVREAFDTELLAWHMTNSVLPGVVQYYILYYILNTQRSYAERLEENEIDIEAMALCSDSDFAEMGIPTGPRLKCVHSRFSPLCVHSARACACRFD